MDDATDKMRAINKMREGFDSWAKDKWPWTWFRDAAWEGWQAAIAAQQPAQGEAVAFQQRFADAVKDRNELHGQLAEAAPKAKLWDTLNAALMSRSGITLDNERDCYEAARQWAEAHDDAGSYKAAVQKLRKERDAIAALKVEAVNLAAPPAPSVPDAEVESMVGRLMSSDVDFDDCEDAAAMLRRLVSGGKASVPGWKMVPVEPTMGMYDDWLAARKSQDGIAGWQAGYAAMLAAAPEPPR